MKKYKSLKALIKDKKEKGWTTLEIANFCGMKKHEIESWISKYDLQTKPKYSTEKVKEILRQAKVEGHQIHFNWEYKNNKKKHLFVCECGEKFKRNFHSILRSIDYYDGYLPCPAIQPYGEYLVREILMKLDMEFKEQYHINFNHRKGLMDFAVFSKAEIAFIEHNGKYHDNTCRFQKDVQKETDMLKEEYCERKGIPLLRITGYEKIEEKIKNFLKEISFKV